MNYNLKRHKLLYILSTQKTLKELKGINNSDENIYIEKHLSYLYILKVLKVSGYELNILMKELTENNEIDYYLWNDEDKRGLFATSKGLTSFANKKYIKLFWDNIINNSKSVVQIFIPILSLIIAYLAITTKLDNKKKQDEKELQEVKLLLLKEQEHIKLLEDRINKNPHNIEMKEIKKTL